MARKDLISITERSAEEQQRMRHNAGVASGKTRRNKALLRDCLQILMEQKYLDEETGKKITGAELLSTDLFKKAVAEKDTAKKAKAFEVLRDTAGQKPVDKVEQTNTNITIDFSDIEE